MEKDVLLRPDGPWSFVVCTAAFLEQVITGMMTCSGIYYIHFQEAFDSSATATSWLCSMAFVGLFLGSVIGGPLSRIYGDRVCCFVGGLISSVGFTMCIYTPNFYLLFFFYGIFGCIGSGVHFMGFIAAVNNYFVKYLHSAVVFLAIGSSVGVSIGSMLLPFLLEKYGWRGTLLIQGGISFNVCACAAVLFLPSPVKSSARTIQLSIFFKRDVVLFSLHSFLAILCESAIYVHLPVLLEKKDFGERYSALSLFVLGISVIVAKLLYTIPCKINVILLYTLTFLVGGVTAILLPFGNTVYVVFVCTVILGFSLSVLGGLTVMVMLELTGKDDFIDVTVISFVCRAIGSVASGPLCGVLYDTTGDYSYAFILAGTSIIIACILLIPAIVTSMRKSRHQLETDESIQPMTDVVHEETFNGEKKNRIDH